MTFRIDDVHAHVVAAGGVNGVEPARVQVRSAVEKGGRAHPGYELSGDGLDASAELRSRTEIVEHDDDESAVRSSALIVGWDEGLDRHPLAVLEKLERREVKAADERALPVDDDGRDDDEVRRGPERR